MKKQIKLYFFIEHYSTRCVQKILITKINQDVSNFVRWLGSINLKTIINKKKKTGGQFVCSEGSVFLLF